MRFRATVLQSGKTATGIEVPADVVQALGGGKRPAVSVTIAGRTFRTTLGIMDGRSMISVSAERRAEVGIAAGDEVDVDLELDTAPRELELPDDLTAALDADPDARRTFDSLSYSNRSWHVLQLSGAKSDETRRRRLEKSMAALREGRAR